MLPGNASQISLAGNITHRAFLKSIRRYKYDLHNLELSSNRCNVIILTFDCFYGLIETYDHNIEYIVNASLF